MTFNLFRTCILFCGTMSYFMSGLRISLFFFLMHVQSDLLVVKKKNKRYCPIYFRKVCFRDIVGVTWVTYIIYWLSALCCFRKILNKNCQQCQGQREDLGCLNRLWYDQQVSWLFLCHYVIYRPF